LGKKQDLACCKRQASGFSAGAQSNPPCPMHRCSVRMVGKVQTKLELFPLPKQHGKNYNDVE